MDLGQLFGVEFPNAELGVGGPFPRLRGPKPPEGGTPNRSPSATQESQAAQLLLDARALGWVKPLEGFRQEVVADSQN
jgi:hypothetical protein